MSGPFADGAYPETQEELEIVQALVGIGQIDFLPGPFVSVTEPFETMSHSEIVAAVENLNPANVEQFFLLWKSVCDDLVEASTEFQIAIDASMASGWAGPAANAASSGVAAHVRQLGIIAEAAESIAARVDVSQSSVSYTKNHVPPVPTFSWGDRLKSYIPLPGQWKSIQHESEAAEDRARDVMISIYRPGMSDASRVVPHIPAALNPTTTSPSGTDVIDMAGRGGSTHQPPSIVGDTSRDRVEPGGVMSTDAQELISQTDGRNVDVTPAGVTPAAVNPTGAGHAASPAVPPQTGPGAEASRGVPHLTSVSPGYAGGAARHGTGAGTSLPRGATHSGPSSGGSGGSTPRGLVGGGGGVGSGTTANTAATTRAGVGGAGVGGAVHGRSMLGPMGMAPMGAGGTNGSGSDHTPPEYLRSRRNGEDLIGPLRAVAPGVLGRDA